MKEFQAVLCKLIHMVYLQLNYTKKSVKKILYREKNGDCIGWIVVGDKIRIACLLIEDQSIHTLSNYDHTEFGHDKNYGLQTVLY